MPPPADNDTGTALRQDGSDWSRDLATLTSDLGGHGVCGWCGSSSSIRVPSLKFVGLTIRKIWRTMCVSINGPGDLDLWPFDLETGMPVSSKVGNLHSEFWHARSSGSPVICCVRDGRTDGQNQRLLPPFQLTGGGIINWLPRPTRCVRKATFSATAVEQKAQLSPYDKIADSRRS